MLTVASWNMHKGPASWENLRSLMSVHGVSVALVQEARQPRLLPDGWQTNPPAEERDRWRIAVPRYRIDDRDGSRKETNRWWASAVVSSGVRRVTSRDPVELHLAADGEFPCSHPGQFAVSDVALTGGRRLTVVSLYGIWDLVGGTRDKYVEATLHRAISDLSVVFQEPAADLVLVAGNVNRVLVPGRKRARGSQLVGVVAPRRIRTGSLRPVPSGRRTPAGAVPVSRPRLPAREHLPERIQPQESAVPARLLPSHTAAKGVPDGLLGRP